MSHKIQEIKNKLKINVSPNFSWEVTVIAISFAMALISFYNPIAHIAVNSFNRVIGEGLKEGIDIEKRISHFYIWYLLLTPVALTFFYWLLNRLYKKTAVSEENKKAWSFSAVISIFTFLPIVFGLNSLMANHEYMVSFGLVFALCLCIASVGYTVLPIKQQINFNTYKWAGLISSVLSLIILLISGNLIGHKRLVYIVLYFVFLAFMILLMMWLGKKKLLTENRIENIKASSIPISFFLGAVSIFIEICNILNQYYIFIQHRHLVSLIIFIVFLMTSAIIYLALNKKVYAGRKWESVFYLGMIFSFTMVAVQLSLKNTITTDLFESAKHGEAVTGLLKYGQIPLIENFDSHMLSNSIWGILYGILNNDALGAVFCYYNVYMIPINYIILYALIKKFFDTDSSFFFVLLLPMVLPVDSMDFAFISIVCLVWALKKNNFLSYLLFWFSIVLICVYRLDNGVAFTFACTVVLAGVAILKRKTYNIKGMAASLAVTLISCFGVFLIICVSKGIPFIPRIKEFISVAMSNVNWAYPSIGEPATASYVICYIIMPLIIVLSVFAILLATAKKRIDISIEKIVIILTMAVAYFFNFSRTMVRHSLLESKISIIIFCGILFLALTASIFSKRNKSIIFVSIFISLSLLAGTLKTTSYYPARNVADDFFERISSTQYLADEVEQKVERVTISDSMKEKYTDVVRMINTVLEPDDTYIDFTNQTLIYTLSGRKKPVYINQSPGLLSGEYSQTCFIDESKKNNAEYVLMPTGQDSAFSIMLDGINNMFRYYKVSEFISENYRPLCKCSTLPYSLWVKKNIYDKAYNKLNNFINSKKTEDSIKIQSDDCTLLLSNNVQPKKDKSKIVLQAGQVDPQVNFTIADNKLKSIYAGSTGNTAKITMDYTASSNGAIKLFYTTLEGEQYSENKSVTKQTGLNGTLEFIIPVTAYSKFQFNPIKGASMQIDNVNIQADLGFNLCDYDYGDSSLNALHTYSLGNIPYYWGTYDKNKAYKNNECQNALSNKNGYYQINGDHIDSGKGNYLLITATSDKKGICTVSLGKDNGSGGQQSDSALAQFYFYTLSGTHTYLVRVSCDFYWYTDINKYLSITANTSFSTKDVKILVGD